MIEILPGIIATLILWLIAGVAFGRYLAEFSFAYVSYYAGLASAMIALVFLYWTASIFVYGGALNAACISAALQGRNGRQRREPASDGRSQPTFEAVAADERGSRPTLQQVWPRRP
jgi:membrane protein